MSKFLINELEPKKWEQVREEKKSLKARHLEERRKDFHVKEIGGSFRKFRLRPKKYRHVPLAEVKDMPSMEKTCIRFVTNEGNVLSFAEGKSLCVSRGVDYKTLIKI